MQRSRKKKRPSLNLANSRFKVGGEIVGPVTTPPVRYRKSAAIQKKLLDTAEYLFARWGYAAVSIRDVTSQARMRVANVSYYFGSKQNLYYEVLRRRAEPLSRMRLERIEAARALKMNRELEAFGACRRLCRSAAGAEPRRRCRLEELLFPHRSGDIQRFCSAANCRALQRTGAAINGRPVRALPIGPSGQSSSCGPHADRTLHHGDRGNRPHRDISRAGILLERSDPSWADDEGIYRRRHSRNA